MSTSSTPQAQFDKRDGPNDEVEPDHYAEGLKHQRKGISAALAVDDDDEEDDESEDGDFAPKEESDIDEEYDEGSEEDNERAGAQRFQNSDEDVSESILESSEAPKKKAKITAKTGKKAQSNKDKYAPKRPMSSYMLWMNAHRGRIKQENPDAEVKDIARLAGAQWKQLSTEEKAIWEAKSKEDKARYNRELTAYQTELRGETANDDQGDNQNEKDDAVVENDK